MPFDTSSIVVLINKKKPNSDPIEKPKGVSIHYLRTQFLQDIQEAGKNIDSQLSDIEDLKSSKHGWLRSKGASIVCPKDGQKGAAYVNCLSSYVGPADFFIPSCWNFIIGDIIEALESLCQEHNLDEKSAYVWIWGLCINQHRLLKAGDAIMSMSDVNIVLLEIMEALGVYENMLGPDHPNTAMYHYNLGELCSEKGYYADALIEYQKAINVHSANFEICSQ